MPGGVVVDPAWLTGWAPIMVLAPHPDDESLGCGGLLAYAFRNHGARVVCMTDGSASHPNSQQWPPARLAEARRNEMRNAVAELGGSADDLNFLDHPDGWLGASDRDAVAEALVAECAASHVRRVFVTSAEDHHEDHRATADIGARMSRLAPDLQIFAYPVWSRWDDPDFDRRLPEKQAVFLPIGDARAAKLAAIEAHASQRGRLVEDDPSGFAMTDDFVTAFVDNAEIFWKVAE
ncbi:PIG-L deacetylase family protein [Paracoccus albicereus]|nr:PIG-L family deacetylase [Paracoccus albicereus]